MGLITKDHKGQTLRIGDYVKYVGKWDTTLRGKVIGKVGVGTVQVDLFKFGLAWQPPHVLVKLEDDEVIILKLRGELV